jgi:hypothetical protein
MQNEDKESSVDVNVQEQQIWLDVIEEKIWASPVGLGSPAGPSRFLENSSNFTQQYGKHVYGYLWRPNQEICSNYSISGWSFIIFIASFHFD